MIARIKPHVKSATESVSTYFYESTPVEREKRLLRIFKEIRDFVSTKLERTTLADVL